ncbi:C-X-C chemokine receptor type 3-like isoform X2 [Astatotilapia calliptera]|uniref:C-X-C chemokine receptor type 3-like isoform X2 n=1 Tax=Astatotilapia calliptera TaxID=8154 RepID=UPI000E40F1E7|nr:C-X-C chemokine receptor type 3-like isoform X2 [Astatotilapia calliptera]
MMEDEKITGTGDNISYEMMEDGKITVTGEDLDWSDLFENVSYWNSSYEGGDIYDLTKVVNFEAVFIPVLYSVVFVVGLLGNGVLLGILARSRKTWSVTDIFILHLGVADILMLVTLPIWAVQYAQSDGWTFGTPLCKIIGSVFTINFYSGILLLACISLDRYLSIVHATQMYSRKKPWVAQTSCLMVWCFSLLLSIIDWIFLEELFDARQGRRECVPNYYKFGEEAVYNWRLASRMIYLIVGFVLPSASMIFCYARILDQLRYGAQSLQKQRAFKVIVAVVVVFFICWMPYNIMILVDTINCSKNNVTCSVTKSVAKAETVTKCVCFIHCCLNPILYAFVGVKFRRQLMSILRSLGCKVASAKIQSFVSNRRSSMWSESADTSHSLAI